MAVPSRRPSTAWTCTLGLAPGPTAISPTSEATSTCSSTGMGWYFLDCQSKNASVALANAPMAVICDAASCSLGSEFLQAAHRLVAFLKDDRESALSALLVQQLAFHLRRSLTDQPR